MESKEFDLGIILSLTTGRIFAKLDKIYDAVDYLTNDKIYTHQMIRVLPILKEYVLSTYPELRGIGEEEKFENVSEIQLFLKEQKEKFGNSLKLSQISKDMGYQHIDPIIEASFLLQKTKKL